MIVPDVPVEAQQLPQARELACALDGVPIRRSVRARPCVRLVVSRAWRASKPRRSLNRLRCREPRPMLRQPPRQAGGQTEQRRSGHPSPSTVRGVFRVEASTGAPTGTNRYSVDARSGEPVPARTPGGGTWSQSAPVPPTRVAHDAAASHSTCSQTACCRVRRRAHAGRSCPSPARRRRSGVHRKVFGCPCHYRRSTSIRSRRFGVGQSRAAP